MTTENELMEVEQDNKKTTEEHQEISLVAACRALCNDESLCDVELQGTDGVILLPVMDESAYRKFCSQYHCVICRDTSGDHRAQNCPIAQACGYEVKFVGYQRQGGRSKGRGTSAQTPAPAPAPAPAPSATTTTTNNNGTSTTSEGYSARRVVGTTRYVLGTACRTASHESDSSKQWVCCPDSGASDDMHHDRANFETYTELADSWVAMGNGALAPVAEGMPFHSTGNLLETQQDTVWLV